MNRKGANRRTRHVDTKVYFMQAWAMELGPRILKVHGDSQQVADCLIQITIPRAAHRKARSNLSNVDESVQKIAAHQITASHLNTFTNTFLINMRMKFYNLKSDDELISSKETFGLCEGRAEQHYYISVRASRYSCIFGL